MSTALHRQNETTYRSVTFPERGQTRVRNTRLRDSIKTNHFVPSGAVAAEMRMSVGRTTPGRASSSRRYGSGCLRDANSASAFSNISDSARGSPISLHTAGMQHVYVKTRSSTVTIISRTGSCRTPHEWREPCLARYPSG